MAKAKPGMSEANRGGRGGKGRPRARMGAPAGKGKLDVGNARRDTGGTPPVARATSKRPPRKSPLQLPGEKVVSPTDRTVPVRPERQSAAEREPIPPQALDRRRQVVGTDDNGRRGGRRR